MPHMLSPPESPSIEPASTLNDLFPLVRKSHILNCAFAAWHSRYRNITPKARTIHLTPAFLSYLRADGIVLPGDGQPHVSSLSDSEDSEAEDENEDDACDPTEAFTEVHQHVIATIEDLGGRVAPKLNWSSPKDAAFISATNTLECRSPSDIYLLLKSSDFITHDLEHAFDNCIDDLDKPGEENVEAGDVEYHLVLRKWFAMNPSMEFRGFVRKRKLLAVSQRDMNHYEFLHPMKEELQALITEFFEEKLKDSFPDEDFVFDVYVPNTDGSKKVWLVDINPFAQRTDPLLFSWMELLQRSVGEQVDLELRLVNKNDPEAYQFASSQYSASKLPQEVVEAGLQGEEAIWEFAQRWKETMERMENERNIRGQSG